MREHGIDPAKRRLEPLIAHCQQTRLFGLSVDRRIGLVLVWIRPPQLLFGFCRSQKAAVVPGFSEQLLWRPCAPGGVVEHQHPINSRRCRELVADHRIVAGRVGSRIEPESRRRCCCPRFVPGHRQHQQRGVPPSGRGEGARLPAGRR